MVVFFFSRHPHFQLYSLQQVLKLLGASCGKIRMYRGHEILLPTQTMHYYPFMYCISNICLHLVDF